MKAILPGRYRTTLLAAHLSAIVVLLISACSPAANVQQPTFVPPTAEQAAAPAVETTATSAPTLAPTRVEATATSLPPTLTPTPAPTATPQLGIGSTRTSEIDGMVQVYVPAGEFLMGSTDNEAQISTNNGRAYPEIPQHKVTLDNYWIDKFEVTNQQYALCVSAGACTPPFVNNSYTYEHYYDNPQFANYPVIWVSWYQAKDYCTWAGRRLPNEAEWEKASRGTDGQKYPWGNDKIDGTKANFCDTNCTRGIRNPAFDDGYPDTAPVGSFPAGVSPYGAMDMSGNVWEWVSSLIKPYPYDANDGREDLTAPGERAWRGGPWSNGFWWMRSSVRYRSVPEYKWYVLGIRCAATP